MEETKEYIETGILELYVLGQLSADDQKEVEAMAIKFPEIKREVDAIEIAMERYAIHNAVLPSQDLTKRIFDKIVHEEAKEAKIVPLHPKNQDAKIKKLRFALVACIALLLVSVVELFSAHRKLDVAEDKIASLSLDREKFAARASYEENTNQQLKKVADMIGDPAWAIVKLAGTKMKPDAKMMVYWNKESKNVVVDNSRMTLPANDAQHQYQLWALVDGKPVDLGVYDSTSDSNLILVKMKEISTAQAFAVTLEKQGGSVSPTMDQMVVMGGVSI